MHPALERPEHFSGLHTALTADIFYSLAPRLPEHYSVSVERGLSMSDEFGDRQTYRPDVRVDQPEERDYGYATAESDTAVLTPPAFAVELVEEAQRLLTIRGEDKQLVTTIEILSPAIKNGAGFNDFSAKQKQLAARGIHLVEIDLLRSGKRRLPDERAAAADYLVSVKRDESTFVHVWTPSLGDPLPTIPVPLIYPDPDLPLPLEAIMGEFLRKSGLGRRLGEMEKRG